jgi:alpha-tubulin suppressor-like RCC1 family protein
VVLSAIGCGGGSSGDPDAGQDSGPDAGPDIAVLVTAGLNHTCALTSTGAIKCWGEDWNGCLGIGYNTVEATQPVNVVGFESGARHVSAGYNHTCAVDAAGGAWCWGDNWDGQLGATVGIESWKPVPVAGLDHGYVAVASGDHHTCALSEQGTVKCWGDNDWGELGDGTTVSSVMPVDVSGLGAKVASIDAGGRVTCAVTEGGAAKCWGMGGRCGDGTDETRTVPVGVLGLDSGVSAVSAGSAHVCARLSDGGLACWGRNPYGQLGDGTNEIALAPVKVVGGGVSFSGVSVGDVHTCAATGDGSAYCWGRNHLGEIGQGYVGSEFSQPAKVKGLEDTIILDTVAGGHHSCALTSTGGIKCWGDYSGGQLGNGMGFEDECVEWDDCPMPTPVDVIGFGE